MSAAGRYCPSDYRYPAADFRRSPEVSTHALYVVGGLYGNRFALDTVEAMAAAEPGDATVVFNGDFHWFDADPRRFAEIDRRVLAHRATRGNVETELARASDVGAGCGCAYPDAVDAGTVERSNRILDRLRRHCVDALPGTRERLAALPMTMIAEVGRLRVGIVHGDAESLAGWRFAHDALDAPEATAWLEVIRIASHVDVYACSHTCLPAARDFRLAPGRLTVINNGAAGMPNFRGTTYGVLTRIATRPSPHPVLCRIGRDGTYIEALPVAYDHSRWLREFTGIWPAGSPAHESYLDRVVSGPHFTPRAAYPDASQSAPPRLSDSASVVS
ncbi:MAG: hypothetical protein M5U08_22495 [Burkholderiales bacterium]|nr:hypothetical protein [Burkholderiales bacterium]